MAQHSLLMERAREVFEAIEFLHSEERRGVRRDVMAKRYRADKIRKLLSDAGHPKTLAKRMGNFLQACEQCAENPIQMARFMQDPISLGTTNAADGDEAPSTEPLPKFGMFFLYALPSEEGDPAGPAAAFMDYVYATVSTMLAKKKADLSNAMLTKNWKSGMVSFNNTVGNESDAMKGDHLDYDYAKDPGAGLFMFCMRANCFRMGPDSFPCQGYPSLVRALDKPLVLNLFSIGPIVSQGISIADLSTHITTPSGVSYMNESSGMARIEPGQTAYIPPGCIAHISYHTSKEEETSEPLAMGLVHTIFSKEMLMTLSDSTWNAIVSYNSAFFADNSKSKVYSARASLVQKFVSDISAERAKAK